MTRRRGAALIVAWRPPAVVGDGDRILSCLDPRDEEALLAAFPDRVICGRRVAADVRQDAIDAFVRICDGIGVVAAADGRTFASALRRGTGCSDWWFHPISSGSWGGGPPVLESLVALLAIDRCASQNGLQRLVMYGAPRPVLIAARARYRVRGLGTSGPAVSGHAWWSALRSRWSLLVTTLRTARAAPPAIAHAPTLGPLVALSATWNLWLKWDERRDALLDTHFTGLDSALLRRGCSSVRLVWLPPPVSSAPRALWERPFVRGDAVVLQTYLTWRDIAREALSIRPAVV
jgi:hypothetical protein